MKDKVKEKKISNAISVTLIVGFLGSIALNAIGANLRYKEAENFQYMKNAIGVPIVADLGFDKTLDVVIDESFDENQKNHIIKAIQELDIDLTGVSYNIVLDSDKAGKKCINIHKLDYDITNEDCLGNTIYKAHPVYGKVMFPVDIELYTEAYTDTFDDPDFKEEYFSCLVKHEMLHVLGFDDVYDEDYINKTIMYGYYTSENTLFDLSQSDIDMVNSVYKPAKEKFINVKTREPLFVNPKVEEEENTL